MILALTIAALAAQPAGADAGTNWEPLTREASSRILIDPASISRDGTLVRARIKTVDERPDAEVASMIMVVVVDCPGRRDAFEAGALYSRDGALINSRVRQPGEPLEWVANPAAGVSVAIHGRVCGAAGETR